MPEEFDLITIGAGSGGIAASRRAAAHGARVLVIEGSRLGGTCVIRGCVPKKLMAYASGFSDAFREATAFGWRGIEPEFDMAHWASAKAAEIDRLEGIYRQMLAGSKVEVVEGWAKLAGPGKVEVDGRRFSAPRLLLATGGTPSRDAISGLDEAMTSNEILDLRELPETLLVIGGGYIACEFASIMAGLGVRVTQAYRDVLPLRGFDNDLRRRLAEAFEARGITLAPGVAFESLRRGSNGGFELLRVDGSVLSAAAALNATGRRPNTAGLGLDAVGVELDDKGAVRVDVDSRSSVDGIWAIGDLTNRRNLTPVAIAEGRAFADSEFGG
ncbi:MAG TPA: FAD-dependent oxidoreductase, partial [Burkholderiaceae bacterium]|nr:FAD-dependent oxidoreductase [Burkholderiaceae bacterium]